MPISSTVVFNKDAFPTADVAAGEPSFSLSIQALFSCVGRQAQYQAFVRFAVASGAAHIAIALDSTRVSEPFTRRGWQGKPWNSPASSRACTGVVAGT